MLSVVVVAAAVSVAAAVPHEKRQIPFCTVENSYTSVAGDSCESIETQFNLTPGSVLTANPFLNCADIWEYTPICIHDSASPSDSSTVSPPSSTSLTPTIPSPSPACRTTYITFEGETCDVLDRGFGLPAGSIKAANDFLNCDDIWANTPICVPFSESSDSVTYEPTTTVVPSSTFDPTIPSPSPVCFRPSLSSPGEDCSSIEARWRLVPGTIKAANDFLNCNDIWPYTPICVPDGPYVQDTQTCYDGTWVTGGVGENCELIHSRLGVRGGVQGIQASNKDIDCTTDLPVGTTVNVCVLVWEGVHCGFTIKAPAGATCESIATEQGLRSAAKVKALNTFVDCDNIWEGTPLCVSL